jgi:hypothetical protein
LIDAVKVGPLSYKVNCQQDIFEAISYGGKDLFGYTDHRIGEVFIDSRNSHDQKKATLVHEILHIVFHASGLGTCEELSEEQIVSTLSMGVLQAIQDNPELLDYLVEPEIEE